MNVEEPARAGTTLHVLLVDDSQDDAEVVIDELRVAGYAVEYVRVETEQEMREALAHGGLIATAGNVEADQATQNCFVLIDQLDPPKWPRIGAALPIRYDMDGTSIHGAGGLGRGRGSGLRRGRLPAQQDVECRPGERCTAAAGQRGGRGARLEEISPAHLQAARIHVVSLKPSADRVLRGMRSAARTSCRLQAKVQDLLIRRRALSPSPLAYNCGPWLTASRCADCRMGRPAARRGCL